MPRRPVPPLIEPRFRLRQGGRLTFGPGKADLLEKIALAGSIAKAARAMNMSYMRAWTLVKSMESEFSEPLVQKLRGGHRRGGAELTDAGKKMLLLYRRLERDTRPLIRKAQKQLGSLLRK
jgi:molybdate transport system regulatory protein